MARIFLLMILVLSAQLEGADIREIKEGPIHEAYVTQEFGTMVYEAVADRPPSSIQEKPPKQPSKDLQWIGGYWAWAQEEGDFIWVSGVWRRPPIGYFWIEGRWEELEEGWCWLPGFWSAVKEDKLIYIQNIPPDSLDESVPRTLCAGCFWVFGTWKFDPDKQQFHWTQGRWQSFDPSWVYVPAHYIWHNKGYLLIGNYWDWPLEKRGQAYAAIAIQPEVRNAIVYQPTLLLDVHTILNSLYPYWPSYISLYTTYLHFHPHDSIEQVPWWNWDEWRAFAWQDQLALWWWWSHPGFPQPLWMTPTLAQKITPAPNSLVMRMKEVSPLINITPNGVIGNEELIKALNKSMPIIPPGGRQAMLKGVIPQKVKRPILTAGGEGAQQGQAQKPNFGPKNEQLSTAPQRIAIPNKPIMPKRVYTPSKGPTRTNIPPPRKAPTLPKPPAPASRPNIAPKVFSKPQIAPPNIEPKASVKPQIAPPKRALPELGPAMSKPQKPAIQQKRSNG